MIYLTIITLIEISNRDLSQYIPAFSDIQSTVILQMFDDCAIAFPSSINLPQRWQESCSTCGRKIDCNQETQDRGGKRSTLIRERQVGLRTTTSSRPLLLLNISAMGRERGVVAWRGHQGNGPPLPLLFITLQSESGTRLSSTCGAGQILLPFPFPLPFHGPSASLHIIHTTKFELYIR